MDHSRIYRNILCSLIVEKTMGERVFEIIHGLFRYHLSINNFPAYYAGFNGACQLGPQKDNVRFQKILSSLILYLLIGQRISFSAGMYFVKGILNCFSHGSWICKIYKSFVFFSSVLVTHFTSYKGNIGN